MARNVSAIKTKRPEIAPDPVLASPDVYKVILENDIVRVIDINLKKGERSEMHSHPSYLVYGVSACKVKFTSIDGAAGVVDFNAGETTWRDPESHSTENVGESDCHVLNIEFKKIP